MGTKTNKVIDFADDKNVRIVADIEVPGYLILDDTWVCNMHKSVFCVETNTLHRITDIVQFKAFMLKPKHQRVSGMALTNGHSNWRENKFSCIKVENQETIKSGYTLVAKTNLDESTLS